MATFILPRWRHLHGHMEQAHIQEYVSARRPLRLMVLRQDASVRCGACSLIRDQDLRSVILVGHSYCGMVITGVADRMAKKIRRLVYPDAALPDPGQEQSDQFPQGNIDPFSFQGPEAACAYVEKLRFDPLRIRRIPKTSIVCTQSAERMCGGSRRLQNERSLDREKDGCA